MEANRVSGSTNATALFANHLGTWGLMDDAGIALFLKLPIVCCWHHLDSRRSTSSNADAEGPLALHPEVCFNRYALQPSCNCGSELFSALRSMRCRRAVAPSARAKVMPPPVPRRNSCGSVKSTRPPGPCLCPCPSHPFAMDYSFCCWTRAQL